MTERERLIRAIEADPDDDAVRLVYADWCEENGDADRARFIRLQCESTRLCAESGGGESPAEWERLQDEASALQKANVKPWTAGLPRWALKDAWFDRGFLVIMSMTASQFLADGAAVRSHCPLDALWLRLVRGKEEAVFGCEHLAAVRHLYLDDAQITDEGVAILTRNPHLRRVRRLSLNRGFTGEPKDATKLTDAACFTLAAANNLPALAKLSLCGHKKITLSGIRAITESERRAGLTALAVSGMDHGGPGGGGAVPLPRATPDSPARPRSG